MRRTDKTLDSADSLPRFFGIFLNVGQDVRLVTNCLNWKFVHHRKGCICGQNKRLASFTKCFLHYFETLRVRSCEQGKTEKRKFNMHSRRQLNNKPRDDDFIFKIWRRSRECCSMLLGGTIFTVDARRFRRFHCAETPNLQRVAGWR